MGRRPVRYLTEKQKAILDFIQSFQAEHGIAPTHREICEEFGYSSYGTVYKHLKLMEKKGYLARDWNQKRGIEVVRNPAGGDRRADGTESAEHPSRRQPEVANDDRPPLQEVPYHGDIAAGEPLEAVASSDTLTVPNHLLGRRPDGHYVLKVVGSSMIEEGIQDGDLVVVEGREKAVPGEMVVALVHDEATLKRYYPEGSRIRLQPSNPAMQPLVLSADEVQVQGVVVGLMRKYL